MKFAEPTLRPENIEIDADERRAVYVQFDRLCKMLEERATDRNMHSQVWPYQEGFVNVMGVYYQLDTDDGSYLWVDYALAQYNDEDEIRSITIEEHAPDATLLNNYKFIVKNEVIYYDGGPVSEQNAGTKEHASTFHMIAVITLAEYQVKHGGKKLSEGSQAGLDMFDNEAANEFLAHRLGYGYRPMKLDEIMKLKEVLRKVSPTPPKEFGE